jgi:hypothetical protein
MKMNKQSGQAIITAAIALVVLCGFTGLAIDMGALRYHRRVQQTAADAAAIAGAQNLQFSISNGVAPGTGVTTGAQYAASQNGFTNGGGSDLTNCEDSASPAIGTTCVQVLNGPADVTFNGATINGGPHSGSSQYVEVLVAKVQPTYFMNVFGVGSKTVVARAVATNISGGANQSCMYTLGLPTSAIIGLDPTGNGKIIAPNCGISDNGNFDTTGKSYTVQAATLSVTGACTPAGACQDTTNTTCTAYTGQKCPTTGGDPASEDPMKGIQPPSPQPAYSSTCGGAVPCDWKSAAGSTTTIQPGTYDSILISKNSTITMAPGIYYIKGAVAGDTSNPNAGLNFEGGGTLVSQGYLGGTNPCSSGGVPVDGVMIYFTNTSTMNKMTGGGNNPDLRLCPMNSTQNSTYAGILFYQDPNDTTQAWIGGDNNTALYGTVYMPTATLNFYGNTSFAMYGTTIVYSVAVTGNPTVTLGTAPSGTPIPAFLTRPSLVE